MPLKMKDMPVYERPYEKLEKYGEKMLSNSELLAIIIKNGTKEENSIELANRILLMSDSLRGILSLSLSELMTIKGIGKVKAIQIKAMCELAKRMLRERDYGIQVKYPKDVAELFMDEFKFEKLELLKLVILNNKNCVMKIVELAKGLINEVHVEVKDIFLEVIKAQANKMIIVHNHPSGDPTPSKQDIDFTKKLYSMSNLLGITLVDHIVVGHDRYESIFSRRDFRDEIIRL